MSWHGTAARIGTATSIWHLLYLITTRCTWTSAIIHPLSFTGYHSPAIIHRLSFICYHYQPSFINNTSTITTWVKGRQLSLTRNRCLQYSNNHVVVVGDNLKEGLSSRSNTCRGRECELQTSGVTPSTTGHECRLQTSGLTPSPTSFANMDCGKWFNSKHHWPRGCGREVA